MHGLGTLMNVGLLVGGGIVGLLGRSRIKPRMQETLMVGTGIAIMFMSMGSVMAKMLQVNATGGLDSVGSMMMIVSIAGGGVIGEIIDLNGYIERFGTWLREKTGNARDKDFINAFVSATCTVCIGAMAVVGSIQDGISGDWSILLAKGVLDAIIVCVMAASMGKGCVFSAIPVALFQGTITLLAALAGPPTSPTWATCSSSASASTWCGTRASVWPTSCPHSSSPASGPRERAWPEKTHAPSSRPQTPAGPTAARAESPLPRALPQRTSLPPRPDWSSARSSAARCGARPFP